MPEIPEHLRTPGHRRALAEQQRSVNEVQFHLRERGVDVTDRDVWQHGVANGPFAGSEEWAASVMVTLAYPDSDIVCSCDHCERHRAWRASLKTKRDTPALGDQEKP